MHLIKRWLAKEPRKKREGDGASGFWSMFQETVVGGGLAEARRKYGGG